MSDPKHPIDDLFARNLAGYEVEPPLHLWAGIAREQRRRRKPIIWFWLAAGAVVAGGLLTLALRSGNPEDLKLGAFAIPVEAAQSPAANAPGTIAAASVPAVTTLPPAAAATVENSPDRTPQSAVTPERLQTGQASDQPAEIVEPGTDMQYGAERPSSSLAGITALLPAGSSKLLTPPAAAFKLEHPEIPSSPVQRCARFKSGKPVWFTELTGAPSIAFRELTPIDPEFSSYAQGREETESSVFSFSVAGRVSLVFPWGLSLRSGIQYSQINERFNFLNTNEQQTIITDIFGPNGQIIRTDTIFVSTTHQYTTRNQYHLIDIPVMVGYEFHADNLTLAISGGPSINMRLGKKGEFLSPEDLEPISFNENQPNGYRAFKDKVGIGWQGNLGLYYEMNSRLDLLFEPYFRLYPQSFTLDEYPVRQRYFMVGLGVGLRMAL